MTRGLLGIVALCMVMAGSLASAGEVANSSEKAGDFPGAADTADVLTWIQARQPRLTAADLRAARNLTALGDRAYRRGNYGAAFTAYSNAYPNAPSAKAYIMTGDAHWRDAVRYDRQVRRAAPAASACRIDNSRFPRDLALDVAQHHRVGLVLGAQDRRFRRSELFRRASASANCLEALARSAAAAPPHSCADIARLAHCLGPPLLK